MSETTNKTTFIDWLDERYPATKVWKEHIAEYYAPKISISGITSVV